MNNRAWTVLGTIAAAVLIFQFFFRYQYIHQNAAVTMRVDRLTQVACIMPCIPTPPPTPTPKPTPAPTPTPEDFATTDSKAIELARARGSDAYIVQQNSPTNNWKVVERFTNSHHSMLQECQAKHHKNILDCAFLDHISLPIREVCFCNSKGIGWYYEVHLDSGSVLNIIGNETLMQLYGVGRKKE